MEIVRTKYDGVYKKVKSSAWGSYYSKVADELATVEKIDTELELVQNFPKMPSELWGAILNLYFDYAINTSLEAQVLLLRDEATLTKWKVVVPAQMVTGASVDTPDFNKCCDILTGEEYTSFPPTGYLHCGSSHSHGTIKLNDFSGTDDANELGVPGLHLLVSTIDTKAMTYKHMGSVVLKKKRYYVDASELVDITPNNTNYHPIVKSYIKLSPPPAPFKVANYLQSWKGNTKEKQKDHDLFNTNIGYDWSDVDKDIDEILEDLILRGYSAKEIKKLVDKVEDKIYGGA